MEQDFFSNLPAEMTMNILSRLPVVTIMSCKCVCRSWLHLLETPEFVKSHFSKSIPGLAVFQGNEISKPYKVYEFVDELDPEFSERYCNLAFKFNFPHHELIHNSTNGLLLLCGNDQRPPHNLIICNPVTRDYIKLPNPLLPSSEFQINTFGFGVSEMSGQYKVVRIFNDTFIDQKSLLRDRMVRDQLECQVYTLGTGSWRNIAPSGPITLISQGIRGEFLNGNFHLLVWDSEASPQISCFDLETEIFSTFSPPPPQGDTGGDYIHSRWDLSTLRDCLCVLETSTYNDSVIWLMNSYGDEKSWTKQFIICRSPRGVALMDYRASHCAIKVFKDGHILIAKGGVRQLLCYSSESNTIGDSVLVKYYGSHSRTSAVTYTPSFLSLKTFTMEKVSSFRSEQLHRKSMKRKKSE